MQFAPPTAARRVPGVLPIVGMAFVPAVIVLTLVCISSNGAEEAARLPDGIAAHPPAVRQSPMISVRLSRQGALTIGGQAVADEARPTVWQRERSAVKLLGFEPAQTLLIVRADPDTPTEAVQQLIEQAQQAGFSGCVLREEVMYPAHSVCRSSGGTRSVPDTLRNNR